MGSKISWLQAAIMGTIVVQSTADASFARVTGLAEIGSYETIWIDSLIAGNELANQVSFLALQYQGNSFWSSNSYSSIISPGLGMRRAFNDKQVFGAYVFGDYLSTGTDQNYWLLGPGIDFYQDRWYASLNGYIPVKHPKRLISSQPASELGNSQYQHFTGHNQYDRLCNVYESIRWGLDMTGGVLFGRNNVWGCLCIYWPSPQNHYRWTSRA